MPGGNSNFLYGRPGSQLAFAELLGQENVSAFTAGPSGQVIIPAGLPAGNPATFQVLYWTGSAWVPATVDSVIRTWFGALPTSLPGTTNTFWNDGGVIAST